MVFMYYVNPPFVPWIPDMDVERCMTIMAKHEKWNFLVGQFVGHVGSSKVSDYGPSTFALPFRRHLDLSWRPTLIMQTSIKADNRLWHVHWFSCLPTWSQLPSGLCSSVFFFRFSSSATSIHDTSSSSLRAWFPCLWKEDLIGEYIFLESEPTRSTKTTGLEQFLWVSDSEWSLETKIHRILHAISSSPNLTVRKCETIGGWFKHAQKTKHFQVCRKQILHFISGNFRNPQ